MTKPFQFCQFGAGRIGKIHAGNIAASERGRLRYVVDVDREAAARLASRFGADVTTAETALNDKEVDAVLIASSTDTHAGIIEMAAKAGKAVFCEKPVDLDLARVDTVIRTVKQAGVPVFVAFNRRFDPTLGGVCREAAGGAAGNVETVIITSRDPSPPPLGYVKVSGGLFLDMMIHDFDLAHWALGEMPVEVFARGSVLVDPDIGAAGDVDTAVVTLVTNSGRLCHISNSRRAVYGYDQRLEIFGSKGMIRAENRTPRSVEIYTESTRQAENPLWFFLERYGDAYRHELEHFLDVLEGRATPLVGLDEARAAMVLALAAGESVKTGLPVRID
ncbi:MAG TPA: inositol 2-dehydrogenase [Rhodobacteraceae bacterium]|nr:inositol 2-dehydrogenase [Paracoccaceae bacterium]